MMLRKTIAAMTAALALLLVIPAIVGAGPQKATPTATTAATLSTLGNEIADAADVVTIRGGGFAYLPLKHRGNDTLLDYTDPAHPTVREPGVYTVGATVECLPDTGVLGPCAEHPVDALLVMCAGPSPDLGVSIDYPFSPKPIPTPRAGGEITWKLDAGDQIGLVVFNYGTPLPFQAILVTIQKVA